ncbi:serine protease, partial [Sphingobium sp. 3R8]
KPMSTLGWLPEWIALQVSVAFDEGSEFLRLKHETWQIDLYDENGNPKWLIHPIHGTDIDVGVLPIDNLDVDGRLYNEPVNTHDEWISFSGRVGDDAFVLGFPKGMDGGKGFPLWKRASIASETNFDVKNLPLIYIDTATREGMSGSPVVVLRRGWIMPDGEEDFSKAVIGEGLNFLGVYSGRIGDDELGVQIGIVWKHTVIDEIITGGIAGTSVFP